MKTILPLSLLLILFTACAGPSYYGPNTADAQMEYLGLKMQLCENSYDNYILSQGTMTGNQSMYDLMLKIMKQELREAKESRDYDNQDEYEQPNDGKELKKAAVHVIEIYIDVAENELEQVKDENLRWESDRCQWFFEGGNIRIQEAYEAYGKIQKKIADEKEIILY